MRRRLRADDRCRRDVPFPDAVPAAHARGRCRWRCSCRALWADAGRRRRMWRLCDMTCAWTAGVRREVSRQATGTPVLIRCFMPSGGVPSPDSPPCGWGDSESCHHKATGAPLRSGTPIPLMSRTPMMPLMSGKPTDVPRRSGRMCGDVRASRAGIPLRPCNAQVNGTCVQPLVDDASCSVDAGRPNCKWR